MLVGMMKNLLWIVIAIYALLGVAWAATAILGHQSAEALMAQQLVHTVGSEVWGFVRPLLQLIVVLLLIEYFVSKAGSHMSPHHLALTWDTRSIVAVVIIATYCIASLSGIQDHYGVKDIVLVVIGFYFGTTRKPGEQEPTVTVPGTPAPTVGSHNT
jgi:hypothetical protein